MTWTAKRIPGHTARVHMDPYWLGDSPRAIAKAGETTGYIDINLQRTRDGVVGLHWGTARKNGYKYLQLPNGRRRKMTRAELNRPVRHWSTAAVCNWRRTARAGRLYRSKVRIHTYAQLVALCKAHDVIPCFELKSNDFGDIVLARQMVKIAHDAQATVYFMTLVVMANWRGKMRAFHQAGAQTALLAHGAHRPFDLAAQRVNIDQIWGRFK